MHLLYVRNIFEINLKDKHINISQENKYEKILEKYIFHYCKLILSLKKNSFPFIIIISHAKDVEKQKHIFFDFSFIFFFQYNIIAIYDFAISFFFVIFHSLIYVNYTHFSPVTLESLLPHR